MQTSNACVYMEVFRWVVKPQGEAAAKLKPLEWILLFYFRQNCTLFWGRLDSKLFMHLWSSPP
jgi:hypothetical protein